MVCGGRGKRTRQRMAQEQINSSNKEMDKKITNKGER
jgi:hypothetical protein